MKMNIESRNSDLSSSNFALRRRVIRRKKAASLSKIIYNFRGSMIVSAFIFMQWGIPLTFVGVPVYISVQIISAIIFLLALLRLTQRSKYGPLRRWEIWILIFIGYCYAVTFVSNVIIFRQSFSEWGASITYLFPLLQLFAYTTLRLRSIDIVRGIIISTTTAALLVLLDHFHPIVALDQYVHFSTLSDSERRVVLMHNESAFSFAILLATMLKGRSAVSLLVATIPVCLIGFSLVVIAETRLAVGASLIGMLLYFVFAYKSHLKLPLSMIGIAVAAVMAPILMAKYLDTFSVFVRSGGSLDQIVASDPGTQFRLDEIGHYQRFFDESGGVGFGLMTISATKHNYLSQSTYSYATMYGASEDYFLSLVDIRIYAALYQFGYPGLIGVLLLTLAVVRTTVGVALRRIHPHRQTIGAIGCVSLGFMCSPLPMNLFTVENTVLLGGMIYAISAFSRYEEQDIALRQDRGLSLGRAQEGYR